MKPRRIPRSPGAGRPYDPRALSRTGKVVHLLISPQDHERYMRLASRLGITLAEFVRKGMRLAWEQLEYPAIKNAERTART